MIRPVQRVFGALLPLALVCAAACQDCGSVPSDDDSGTAVAGDGDGDTVLICTTDDDCPDGWLCEGGLCDRDETDAGGDGDGDGDTDGGDGDGLPDIGNPPPGYSTTPPAGADPEACSTDQWWGLGDQESERMHPGGNCISCHLSSGEGPAFTFAGTVMGAYDDAQDCRGIPGVLVEIVDANGDVALSLTTNAAGNFFSQVNPTSIDMPYTARVSYDGRTREMGGPQTTGNCMNCHTEAGANGAPGRILLP